MTKQITPLKTLATMSSIINHLLSRPKVFGRPYLLWWLPLLVSGGNRRLMISCRATRCNGFAQKKRRGRNPLRRSALFLSGLKVFGPVVKPNHFPCAKSCDDRMAMISYLSQSCNGFSSNHPEEETKKNGGLPAPRQSALLALYGLNNNFAYHKGYDVAQNANNKISCHKSLLSGPKVFSPAIKPNHFWLRKFMITA